MKVTQVTENTYQLSVNVENILFEGLWEIPNGVSLNSFIVKGDKTAIIDGVCGWDGVPETLFELLRSIDVDPATLEYIIINHMEPDHSGWLENFKKIQDHFKIICTKSGASLLDAFFEHSDNITIVKDGDTLDLGNGHILQFTEAPNVHWPDTMVTFDKKTGTLFSCDAFGSYGRIDDKPFDDQLTEEEFDFYEKEAVRYYANILPGFSLPVKKAIDKCATLPIKIIAPGHGIVWRQNPNRVVADYKRYVSYSKGPAKKEITLIWGSMYGMTEKAVRIVEQQLIDSGITTHVHQIPQDSWGTVLASAWTSSAIVLAMPTYEFKMFPPMAAMLEELGKKKVVGKKAFRLGSYGWSGGAEKELHEINTKYKMNWEFLEPVEFLGAPKAEDIGKIQIKVAELIEYVNQM